MAARLDLAKDLPGHFQLLSLEPPGSAGTFGGAIEIELDQSDPPRTQGLREKYGPVPVGEAPEVD